MVSIKNSICEADLGTMSKLSKFSYTGFKEVPRNIAVLYKQNMYFQAFTLLIEKTLTCNTAFLIKSKT